MTIHSNNTFFLKINKLQNLPALPELSLKILDAINDPEVSIDKLSELLSMSPGLVARLLGLANSAYFRQPKQINDLNTAIYKVLGLDLVKSLALSIVLNVQLDTQKCRAFNTEYFWTRSLLTAVCAQKVACQQNFKHFPPSTIYTSGLLLYIGMLVLGYLMPSELDVILYRCKRTNSAVGEEIRVALGESHFKIGYYLLHKWQLSPTYQAVLNFFENTEFHGEEKPLINLLTLSQHISFMMLEDKQIDFIQLEKLCEKLSIPFASLPDVVAELTENRENIHTLALILGQ